MLSCVDKGIQLCDIALEDNSIPENIKSSVRNVRVSRIALRKKVVTIIKNLSKS